MHNIIDKGFILMKRIFTLLVVFLCSCSATQIEYQNNLKVLLQNSTNEDYGTLPKEYKTITETGIKMLLKDPDSAKFIWSEPYRCNFPAKDSPATPLLGWCTKVKYNAKNSFGGYVGYKLHETRWYKGDIYSVCSQTQNGLIFCSSK